jgi:WD40 repeat protein
MISGHDNCIAHMEFDQTGTLLATASERGTLIRVWNVEDGSLAKELRRGIDPAIVTSLSFNDMGDNLLVCSEKGTVHIFSLSEKQKNSQSSFSYINDYLPGYFNSEWSFLTIDMRPHSLCTFNGSNILVITPEKKMYNYYINNGEIVQTYTFDIQ